MAQNRLVLLCLFIILALTGCALPGSKAASLEKELEDAFNNFLAVTNEARITFDTTKLSNVATGQYLQGSIDFIEMYKRLEAEGKSEPVHAAEEFKVEWVNILASGSSWAVVEAKESYLSFSQDLRSGKKIYDNVTRWRVHRFFSSRKTAYGKWTEY
jgi:hypothetical protein